MLWPPQRGILGSGITGFGIFFLLVTSGKFSVLISTDAIPGSFANEAISINVRDLRGWASPILFGFLHGVAAKASPD